MARVNEEVINYDLIEDVLQLLLVDHSRNEILLPPEACNLSNGSVLVFLPGIGEIRSLTDRLQGSRTFGNNKLFDIIPMHSTLSSQDQRRAFMCPPKGCRKIILCTNIAGELLEIPFHPDQGNGLPRDLRFAETSVTIPDVVCGTSTWPDWSIFV